MASVSCLLLLPAIPDRVWQNRRMERLPTLLFPSSLQNIQPIARSLSQTEIRQAFSQTTPPMGVHAKPPKGRSESQFERDLWQYFPGKIHTGLLMRRSDYHQPYVPDFAYIDPDFNLHLDIEVDEPYTHDTHQPLHYWGCPKDMQRNQAFLDWGWGVIRFSEAQVIQAPASCCKTIASVIAQLTGDSSIMNAFRHIPTLKPARRWTETEAQQMAESAYRDSYSAQTTPQANPARKKRQRQQHASPTQGTIVTANFTFYCPECGEGPIPWRGHYVCCPTCQYDAFVL